MKDDLENVKNLGTSLMLEMSKITSDFKIGEGFSRVCAKKCVIAAFVCGITCQAAVPAHTHTYTHRITATLLYSDNYGPTKEFLSPPVLQRFWFFCGKDSHAVHQHHPSQAAEPVHR